MSESRRLALNEPVKWSFPLLEDRPAEDPDEDAEADGALGRTAQQIKLNWTRALEY